MKKANTMGLPFMRVHLRVEEALVRLTLGNKMLVLETLSEGQLFVHFPSHREAVRECNTRHSPSIF